MSVPLRVLVVDDDESIREFVGMALSDEGYDVAAAPHGAAALRSIAELPPSLILLDLRMPVMDAWEFVRVYRETPGPHAPIIAFTAAQESEASVAEIGADDVLPKPFDLEQLLEMVGRYAGHR